MEASEFAFRFALVSRKRRARDLTRPFLASSNLSASFFPSDAGATPPSETLLEPSFPNLSAPLPALVRLLVLFSFLGSTFTQPKLTLFPPSLSPHPSSSQVPLQPNAEEATLTPFTPTLLSSRPHQHLLPPQLPRPRPSDLLTCPRAGAPSAARRMEMLELLPGARWIWEARRPSRAVWRLA